MTTEPVQKQVKELPPIQKWEQIKKILRTYRDSVSAKIMFNEHTDEKIHSECDCWKKEIKIIQRILNIDESVITVEEQLTEEEIIAKENDELDPWLVEDLYRTQE